MRRRGPPPSPGHAATSGPHLCGVHLRVKDKVQLDAPRARLLAVGPGLASVVARMRRLGVLALELAQDQRQVVLAVLLKLARELEAAGRGRDGKERLSLNGGPVHTRVTKRAPARLRDKGQMAARHQPTSRT